MTTYQEAHDRCRAAWARTQMQLEFEVEGEGRSWGNICPLADDDSGDTSSTAAPLLEPRGLIEREYGENVVRPRAHLAVVVGTSQPLPLDEPAVLHPPRHAGAGGLNTPDK